MLRNLFLICCITSYSFLLQAAFPKDAYLLISGGAYTGYDSTVGFGLKTPTTVAKKSDGSTVTITNTSSGLGKKIKDFVDNNKSTTLSKNISLGIMGHFGYAFTKYFRTEIEGSYSKGKVASNSELIDLFFTIPTSTTNTNVSGGSIQTTTTTINNNNDSYTTFNFAANFICDIENSGDIIPFIGGGVGSNVDSFWGSNSMQLMYKFIAGLDLIFTPYLNATLAIDYIKSGSDSFDTVFALKRDKIINESGEDYIVFKSGYGIKTEITPQKDANRFKFGLGLKFII